MTTKHRYVLHGVGALAVLALAVPAAATPGEGVPSRDAPGKFTPGAPAPGPPETGSASEDPKEVIRSAIDKAFVVLRDTQYHSLEKRRERMTRLRVVVDQVFDWERMAQSSLGVHWRPLTSEQRKRYISVFVDVLAAQYMDDMDKFQGNERVIVDGEESQGDTTLVRSTLITHSREKVPINYYMHRDGKQWRIHDLSIEGVSLVNHYRASFHRFLVNRDFEELMRRLESKRVTGT